VPGNRAAADRNDDLGAGPTSQTAYAESTKAPWIVTILAIEFVLERRERTFTRSFLTGGDSPA
jgi:hypothetical protein